MSDYRSMVGVLEERRTELAREILTIAQKKSELEELATRMAACERELRELDEKLVAISTLPGLDSIHVASPCSADWEKMAGDARVRFCGFCQKNVYNLEAMSRTEAEALMLRKEGAACIRFARRADGTVITNDCPVGQKKKRRRLMVLSAAAAASVAAGTALSIDDNLRRQDGAREAMRLGDIARDAGVAAPMQRTLGGGGSFIDRSSVPERLVSKAGDVERREALERSSKRATKHVIGCNCAPGDPLCACL